MNMKTIALFRQNMRQIERAVMLQNKNEATCCGVTLAQCHAVLEIGSADGMSVKELSARLGLDKSTLSRTVESLVEDGLAERTTSPEDRRVIVIRLTAKGRASADRINATWNRICAECKLHQSELSPRARNLRVSSDDLPPSQRDETEPRRWVRDE